ncbi:hypothetical protein ABBQ38_006030 [Trebouxia sp. C0009 RCD-2024]
MTSALLLAVLAALATAHAADLSQQSVLSLSAPRAPKFSASFELQYTFSLPYERSIQPDGVKYPVHIWKDAESSKLRMDTYNHTNSLITTKDDAVVISPRIDSLDCNDLGPYLPHGLGSVNAMMLGASVLPDVSAWEYKGQDEVRNQHCNVWERRQRHGRKTTIYKYYATTEGTPVRLHMHGNDISSGAHFDEYLADFTDYKSGRPDDAVFAFPDICTPSAHKAERQSFPTAAFQMSLLLPSTRHSGDEVYDDFAASFGRRHATPQEYEHRRAVFHDNRQFIEEWNSEAQSSERHMLALNHFADWTQEEFEAIMLPKHNRPTSNLPPAGKHLLQHEALAHAASVPSTVSWVGTGGGGLVTDQAVCGSCWAFATAAALQGALWMKTGKAVHFSEQQVMDCSWDYEGNSACDGGEYSGALDYLIDAGGAVMDQEYEYLGQDGWCTDKNHSDAHTRGLTRFKGYAFVPQGDDEALKEAVYSRGPLAVSLDAGHPSFRFYSHGVYQEPDCKWKAGDLDHAVTLVGYGTSERGQDYWLIKNSWSIHWGNGGYVAISREHHACGITTSPMYAIVADDEVS